MLFGVEVYREGSDGACELRQKHEVNTKREYSASAVQELVQLRSKRSSGARCFEMINAFYSMDNYHLAYFCKMQMSLEYNDESRAMSEN